jgi:hypothetical protein
MTPKEARQFVAEARQRADERARKWHSNPKVKAAAKADYLATFTDEKAVPK